LLGDSGVTVAGGSPSKPEPVVSALSASAEGLTPRRRLAAGANVLAYAGAVWMAISWAARAETKLLCAAICADSRAFDVLVHQEGGSTRTATPSTRHGSALAASSTAAETKRSRRRLRELDALGVDDLVGVPAAGEVSPSCWAGQFRPGQKDDSWVWLRTGEEMGQQGAVRGQHGVVKGQHGAV